MKTKHIIIVFMAMLLPYFTSAQSFLKTFDNYADKEGFDSVTISGELLKMMVNESGKVELSGQEFDTKGFDLSNIKGIKILNLDGDTQKYDEFTKEIEKELNSDKSYEELLAINSEGERIRILALKDKQMKLLKEIVIYRKNSNESAATFIYLQGPFKDEAVNAILKLIKH